MKILAITSCPNGIAHTYMAAENLQKAGAKLGVEMKVETQGSIGVENQFTEQDIHEADGIIIAADKTVVKDRFVGKTACRWCAGWYPSSRRADPTDDERGCACLSSTVQVCR